MNQQRWTAKYPTKTKVYLLFWEFPTEQDCVDAIVSGEFKPNGTYRGKKIQNVGRGAWEAVVKENNIGGPVASFGKHGPDWCHVCGNRRDVLVDVWFPENAEDALQKTGPREQTRYLRICKVCLSVASGIAGK